MFCTYLCLSNFWSRNICLMPTDLRSVSETLLTFSSFSLLWGRKPHLPSCLDAGTEARSHPVLLRVLGSVSHQNNCLKTLFHEICTTLLKNLIYTFSLSHGSIIKWLTNDREIIGLLGKYAVQWGHVYFSTFYHNK